MNTSLKKEIKSKLSEILKKFFLCPNDKDIRCAVNADICKYLSELCENNSIHDFYCICDETNNDASVVQSNCLKRKVGIKFNKNADFIVFDMTLEPQKASFEDIMK